MSVGLCVYVCAMMCVHVCVHTVHACASCFQCSPSSITHHHTFIGTHADSKIHYLYLLHHTHVHAQTHKHTQNGNTTHDSRAKASQLLHQLLDVKDGRVFDRLAVVCNPLAEEVCAFCVCCVCIVCVLCCVRVRVCVGVSVGVGV